MSFIFENEKELYLRDCDAEHVGLVYQAYWDNSDLVQIMDSRGEWYIVVSSELYSESVYRVLAAPYTLEDSLEDLSIKSQLLSAEYGLVAVKWIKENEARDLLIKLAASKGGDE